jgi:hypothetical protein
MLMKKEVSEPGVPRDVVAKLVNVVIKDLEDDDEYYFIFVPSYRDINCISPI